MPFLHLPRHYRALVCYTVKIINREWLPLSTVWAGSALGMTLCVCSLQTTLVPSQTDVLPPQLRWLPSLQHWCQWPGDLAHGLLMSHSLCYAAPVSSALTYAAARSVFPNDKVCSPRWVVGSISREAVTCWLENAMHDLCFWFYVQISRHFNFKLRMDVVAKELMNL